MSDYDAWVELTEIYTEMYQQSDRAAALAGGSFLEDTLRDAIITRFVTLSQTRKNALFKGTDAPLSKFSAKIEIGFALHLYGDLTRIDLDHIRKIRNFFAHSSRRVDFTVKRIVNHCMQLTTPGRIPIGGIAPDPLGDCRSRYISTVCHLSSMLHTWRNPLRHILQHNWDLP